MIWVIHVIAVPTIVTSVDIVELKAMTNQLAEIKEACIKANEEILWPVFGCCIRNRAGTVFTISGQINGKPYIIDHNTGYGHVSIIELTDDISYEILGRKIGIADILLAIEKNTKPPAMYQITDNGIFTYRESKEITATVLNSRFLSTGISYNLLDDNIDHQSQPTIAFIHSVLYGK